MKAVEFCYWLQGYFELSDAGDDDRRSSALGNAATACIKAHLALVATADPGHRNAFVSWLDLFLRDRYGLDASSARIIRETLSAQFHHVIDASYGADQKALNAAHGVGGVGPNGEVYRC